MILFGFGFSVCLNIVLAILLYLCRPKPQPGKAVTLNPVADPPQEKP